MKEITQEIKKFSSAYCDTGTQGDTGTKRVKEDIIKRHLAHCIFLVISKINYFLWYLLFYSKLQVIKTGCVNNVPRKPCVIRVQQTLTHFLVQLDRQSTTECMCFSLKIIIVYT